jgi:hypothetical protein
MRIFSKLRNFGALINQIMDNTIAYFGLKDEDDYMYKKAEAKAAITLQKRLEQNQRFTVIGLLDITSLTDVQIITACNVSAERVQLDLPINWVEKHI